MELKRTKDIKQWLKLYSLELTKLGSRYGTFNNNSDIKMFISV